VATGANSVALGANSTDGGQSNVVSVGSPGAERRITNVAPGVGPTDAVNYSQLLGAESFLQNNINAVQLQANAGVALSLAASGLSYDNRPGTTSISGGASYYMQHEGLAFGIGHTSDDGNWRYHVATTFVTPQDHAEVGVVAGFSYTFGH
jgi:autotransporter adhesin